MGLLQAAGNYFLEPEWLYALLILIPFVLLYLIKPKPKHQVIPSIMFLFRDMGRSRKNNFFRKLIRDLLFLIQLLILLLLIIAMTKPYINVSKESLFKNTVIVLDASASMQADYNDRTRFEHAKELARDDLGSINTLVLAKNTPEVVLVEESAGEASGFIRRLEATETTTNLYDAISTAGGYAGPDSKVVVISDFIDTETSTELSTARRTLESQGIKVDFVRVFESAGNIGIIDMDIDNEKTSVVVKNFYDEPKAVRISVDSLEQELNIDAGSTELFSFSTPEGSSEVKLDINDGFEPDNQVFISTPQGADKSVLMITNHPNPEKTYIYNVFDVMSRAGIETAKPPKIPDLGNYDIYIFHDLDPNLILPGTFRSVREEVEEKGKSAVIMAQASPASMLSIDYQGLMRLPYTSLEKNRINIVAGGSDSLTSNIEFGFTEKYFITSMPENSQGIKIAAADDANKTPIISFNPLGEGKVFYYGILDNDPDAGAGFAKSPAYFVFWKRLADFATDTPSINNLNFRTGNVLSFNEEQKIQTPEGRITTDRLSLDNAGLYTLNNRAIAINLLSQAESDINAGQETGIDDELFEPSQRFREKVPYDLSKYLIIAALVLLFIEFIYIKLRGDL